MWEQWETDEQWGNNDFVFNHISDRENFFGNQLAGRTGKDHLVPVIGNDAIPVTGQVIPCLRKMIV